MNFIAIDFETAHANFPCEIGITRVEDLRIVETRSWLIKPACYPYMNYWNHKVHGISSEELVDEKTFDELWPELKLLFEDQVVVAHNAAFDMKVLSSSLSYYDLAYPPIEYFCSVQLSRRVWKGLPSHSLGALAEFFDIKFDHHRAGDDARVCAQIVIKALYDYKADNLSELFGKTGISLKKLCAPSIPNQ